LTHAITGGANFVSEKRKWIRVCDHKKKIRRSKLECGMMHNLDFAHPYFGTIGDESGIFFGSLFVFHLIRSNGRCTRVIKYFLNISKKIYTK
jgi:hypothetical protein